MRFSYLVFGLHSISVPKALRSLAEVNAAFLSCALGKPKIYDHQVKAMALEKLTIECVSYAMNVLNV